MGSRNRSHVLILIAIAFIAQKVFSTLPGHAWFVSVFLTVDIAGKFLLAGKDALLPSYLEDMLLGLLLCAGLGALAWYLDAQISIYTGKAGGPAVPALVFAILDVIIRR